MVSGGSAGSSSSSAYRKWMQALVAQVILATPQAWSEEHASSIAAVSLSKVDVVWRYQMTRKRLQVKPSAEAQSSLGQSLSSLLRELLDAAAERALPGEPVFWQEQLQHSPLESDDDLDRLLLKISLGASLAQSPVFQGTYTLSAYKAKTNYARGGIELNKTWNL